MYDIWYIGYSTWYGIKKVHITLHIIHNIVCRMYIYIYIYYCILHINCKISNSYQISINIHYYSRKISTFQKSNVKTLQTAGLGNMLSYSICGHIRNHPQSNSLPMALQMNHRILRYPKLAWDINCSKPHRLRPHQPVTVHFIPWSFQEPIYWRCLP